MVIQAHLFIKGRVQGVSFRAFIKRQARNLGLRGYVKNLPDGRMEAVLVGDKDKVKEAVEKCQEGPPFAGVESVQVSWSKPKEVFPGFEIKR